MDVSTISPVSSNCCNRGSTGSDDGDSRDVTAAGAMVSHGTMSDVMVDRRAMNDIIDDTTAVNGSAASGPMIVNDRSDGHDIRSIII